MKHSRTSRIQRLEDSKCCRRQLKDNRLKELAAHHGKPTSEPRDITWRFTQCYLPPDTSERTSPNPSQASWYSIYLPKGPPVNSTHHSHLLLLSPKADTHFTIPRKVEG